MRISRYSEKDRFNAVMGAVTRHKEMKRKIHDGEIISLHRRDKSSLIAREQKKGYKLVQTEIYFKAKYGTEYAPH